MKISEIKQEFAAATYGEWMQWGERPVYLRVRGFFVPEYQRALRAVLASMDKLPENASVDQQLERDELVGRAMLPYLCRYVLLGWWGLDAEVPALTEALQPDWQPTVAGVHGGMNLYTYVHEGREFRRLDPSEEGGMPAWQEMVPYTPEAALSAFSDPRCGELLMVVKAGASLVDRRTLQAEAEALGKRQTSSIGTSDTANTPKR